MDGVAVHQSKGTACLTIVGMTAPVLGFVLIGKQGPIKRGCACACRALAGGGHPVLVDSGDRYQVPGRFWVYVARCQPALQQKCAQQHLLVWWAVVCATHTQRHIEKFMVLWYCFGTDYAFVALVQACARVFWCQYLCLFGTLPGVCSAAEFFF